MNASAGSEPRIYSMMNFRWKREIIEETDERIAIRFIGSNYTEPDKKSKVRLHGKLNLTVSFILFVYVDTFPKNERGYS